MAEHSARHAAQVVEQFRAMLDRETAAAIDPEHFEELRLMIESAIDTAVLMRLERIATEIGDLAKRVRHDAEAYVAAG